MHDTNTGMATWYDALPLRGAVGLGLNGSFGYDVPVLLM